MRNHFTTIEDLRAHRAAGGDLRRAVLIGLDLTGHSELLRTGLDEAVLLGCQLTGADRQRAEASNALMFPDIPGLPYRPYRDALYTPAELFAGFDPARPESYHDTPDALIYRHSRERVDTVGITHPDPLHALAERLHDHSITEALSELLQDCARAGRAAPVAVMGGHASPRGGPGYRLAAELGAALGASAQRFTVLTGGGPGVMEAVPLGVAVGSDGLAEAISTLSAVPTFQEAGDPARAIGRWLAAAWELPPVSPGEDGPPRTVGIPTWFYGHEPPNTLCHMHAKYFANSVREDGLLTVATGGIVYTPGSAGTLQEIFQDYSQNHYGTLGPAAPMVFLGCRFWTEEVPAAPLVRQLAKGRDAERWIAVTDDVAEAVALLEQYHVDRTTGGS